ncbi:putative WIYLD domain-containing protein [Rosa chinensis]|uniref:Putative WIYLD domain-containing protein n=1 Tax=Rosa chinensis TaxID=74649 RepID=A0A2P6SL55_ROSCH|nr:uncharacterized protein LOC112177682 [Rosa chinensis]PRQ59401.1 putative WIYLD domain-containing protein [Rosa chinensis]
MAPRRGRGGPPKTSRMAAAVEAMADMGFEPKLVRQKVNRLLKKDLYGEEGWRFIEEGSYSVLLEALLEEQTDGDENGNASPEKSKGGKDAETAGAGPSSSKNASPKKSTCGNDAETSVAGLLSKYVSLQTDARGVNDTETSGAGLSIIKYVSPQTDARGVNDAESSGAGPSSSKVASVENDPSGGSEVETSGPIPSSSTKVFLPCSNIETVSRTLQSKDDLDSSSHNEPLTTASPTQLPDADNFLLPTEGEIQGQQGTPVTHSVQEVDTLPARRRRPYHGWVGCDDDDFVEQTEAPLPEVLRKMFILTVDSGKRKRKRRWDVKPENM